MPWILSRVCARWRQIARAVSPLWNRVNLQLRSKEGLQQDERLQQDEKRFQQAIIFLQTWLPAVGSLSLQLVWDNDIPDNNLHLITLPFLHRLKTLHLCISTDACKELLNLSPQLFGALVDLTLAITDVPDWASRRNAAIILKSLGLFRYTVTLRKLTFNSTEWVGPSLIENPLIPFAQLEHLDLLDVYRFDSEQLVPLLRHLVAVKTFSYPRIETTVTLDEEVLPCLSAVTIPNVVALNTTIPWTRLTTLVIKVQLYWERERIKIRDILNKTIFLEALTIDSWLDDSESYLTPSGSLTLASLHTLTISPKDTWMLDDLIVPQLREVLVESYWALDPSTTPSNANLRLFLAFITRVPALEKLSIDARIDSNDKSDPFHTATTLSNLHSLCIAPDDTWILPHLSVPRLREVHLQSTYFVEADAHVPKHELNDMITRSGCTFPTVELHVNWRKPT
ncbi:hypothetical protein DXG01_001897 [Tephrocybe rancida]|nr:hypothetical protein DXG01_001897 [Tephrocybe rancida]